MLATKDISVIISKKTIIQDISYQFEKGKIYGIIGPNGAGKSTYLKVLSGFLKPTTGQVHFQGKALIEPQKNISIVWQKPYMFQTTVYRNLIYGLKLRGIKKREMKERIEEISQLFQLNNILEQQATSLSGGETAKVAIARAVALSPEILILDEPTASLDPKSVLEIEQIIKNLKSKYNMSIILVTHNMFQAKRIAEVTLFFHGGKLIESLTTEDLFNNPTNPLTKNFVSGESFY